MNNIAIEKDLPLVVVVNDNARPMPLSPTKGGLADHLATLRTTRGYENVPGRVALSRTPVIGGAVYGAMHGMKKGLKDMVAPQGLFEDLGLSISDRSTDTTSRPSNRHYARRGPSVAR